MDNKEELQVMKHLDGEGCDCNETREICRVIESHLGQKSKVALL